MGQSSIYQEPLPIKRGGLALQPSPGVLVTNPLGTAVQPLVGSNGTVLRSNGTGWEFGVSGKVIQTGIATYSTPLSLTSASFFPSGLAITISPFRSDTFLAVVARINGITRFLAGGVLLLSLLRDGSNIKTYGFPALYSPEATNLGIGNATTSIIVPSNSTASTTFSVIAMNQSATGNVLLHWGGGGQVTVSSIMFFEVLSV